MTTQTIQWTILTLLDVGLWKRNNDKHNGYAVIKNALNNRRTGIKIAINSVFDCHLPPFGRQMKIKNSVRG